MASNQWQGSYYLKASGAMAEKEWIFDKNYDSWFYLKSGGAYAEREWIGSYYLKVGGYMAKSEWIDDSYYKARYYVDENGVYVTGTHKIDGQTHQFQSNGKWIGETSVSRGFEKGKYNHIIFLDPGHGGKDTGASYYNITEKELNMQVYQKLRKELEGLGYTVLSSRDSDIFVDFVTERSKMVNKTDSDIFISIHFSMLVVIQLQIELEFKLILIKKLLIILLKSIRTGIIIPTVSVKVIASRQISTLHY